MKKLMLIAAIMTGALTCQCAFAEATEVTGEISSVIVYRGEALVTRTIEAQSGRGSSELIVGNLLSILSTKPIQNIQSLAPRWLFMQDLFICGKWP